MHKSIAKAAHAMMTLCLIAYAPQVLLQAEVFLQAADFIG
jgi:hypothetical protein